MNAPERGFFFFGPYSKKAGETLSDPARSRE
jgi:hypothetical protein